MDDKNIVSPDAIENWASWLDTQPKHTPLNKDQMDAFMAMTLNEDAVETDEDSIRLVEPKRPNYASMFYNRVKMCHTYTISVAAAIFISTLIHNPGEVAIFSNFLQYKAYKTRKKRLAMRDITFIWAYGFFSEETMQEAWNKQKCKGCFASNLLDCYDAQKSIEIDG